MDRVRRILLLWCIVAPVLYAESRAAVWGEPVGGEGSETDGRGVCRWTSTLHPNPALPMTSCIWVEKALEVQGYKSEDGWTIVVGAALAGKIEFESYYAWVTTAPELTFGSTTFPAEGPSDCFGGAVVALTYAPGEGDPTGADVKWLQAVSTNSPRNHGKEKGYAADDGYYWYLDNEHDLSQPFYPSHASSSTGFLDRPSRYCPDSVCPCGGSLDWDAQVFVSTWDQTNKKITVYGKGVWWGFDLACVPEPTMVSLLVLGCGLVFNRRGRLMRG